MRPTNPETAAREKIDRLLAQAGWIVQDRREMEISAGPGVAIREFPLTTGFADYLLYANGRAIGLVEAKPEGYALRGVEIQSAKYVSGLPQGLPRWTPPDTPLPFAYESTGTVTQFTSNLDPDPRSREVFSFHRPDELVRLASLETQLRANVQEMPVLDTAKLWDKQVTAIAEQAEVDRRLSVADAAETQVEHALQRAARLRQAILKRAFEGKLVTQDPTDEPAAALLEGVTMTASSARIRTAKKSACTLGGVRRRASTLR